MVELAPQHVAKVAVVLGGGLCLSQRAPSAARQVSYSERFIVGIAGAISVRAEARDTLGSVSATVSNAILSEPATAPAESAYLSVLDNILSSGVTGFQAVVGPPPHHATALRT